MLTRKKTLSRGSPLKRTPIKKKKRSAAEFARVYHSVERVMFVMEQPCAACGRLFASENAHVLGNDGLSRKKAARTIAPLCGPQFSRGYTGCHRMFDELPALFRAHFPDFDPEREAAKLERAWQAFTNGANE